jgi:hypothetical protein
MEIRSKDHIQLEENRHSDVPAPHKKEAEMDGAQSHQNEMELVRLIVNSIVVVGCTDEGCLSWNLWSI